METSLKVFLCLTWLLGNMAQKSEDLPSRYVHQDKGLIPATVGESVTLPCSHQDSYSGWLFWYKQSPGQTPRLMSTCRVSREESSFFNEFNTTRFTAKYDDGVWRLSISDLHISDSATYFCASSHVHTLTFAEGITVTVQGSGLDLQALVHNEGLQPSGPWDLSCTLHNGSCGEEHSVYWFTSSDGSHSGLINDKGDTKTHTCVYNTSLNAPGADHCAVLSCGHILYGNENNAGTKPDTRRFVQVCVLSGALAAAAILTVLLAFARYKMLRRGTCLCSDSPARLPTHSTTNPEGNQDAEDVHYAAVNVNPINRTRQLGETWEECVYSSLKQ